MSTRQFDSTTAPMVQGAAGRQVTGGKSVLSETATPQAAGRDGLSSVALGVGVLPAQAQAATLSRLSGGRLDRAGDALLWLQRRHGNRYVQRLVGHARRYTDADADTSARAGNALRSAGNRTVGDVLQRDKDEVMAGEQVRSVLRSGGAPLDPSFQDRAESFLGADLSQVRVHTGPAAAESARAVQSHAYTSGVHVVFGQGMYDTRSRAGQDRLVHELTHVVQQQRGSVAGTDGAGGLSLSDPSDRFEREAGHSGAAFASAATQLEGQGLHRGVVDREAPALQRFVGIASRSASAPVPIQRFMIPSDGVSFTSRDYGIGYLYMKAISKLSLQPGSGGSGGYDVVESHVTVFPYPKDSTQANNFHVTFVLTSNEGEAGSGRTRKQKKSDTSGKWGKTSQTSVPKGISIHFYFNETGQCTNDFYIKFGTSSNFNTSANFKKLSDAAKSIAKTFVDDHLKKKK